MNHECIGLIMYFNKNEEWEQSFVEAEIVEPPQREQLVIAEITNTICEELPANELITPRRPGQLAPRTLFLQQQFYLLNDALNEPCREESMRGNPQRLKQRLLNKERLTMEQYFDNKSYRLLYNKLQGQKLNVNFTGRLVSIDSLLDYNEKNFKQLGVEINLLEDNRLSKEANEEDHFDSNFQSGNLCRVYVDEQEKHSYYLMIENDMNTYGYNNWFFFRVRNASPGVRRFNIMNFIKKTSFFSQGMLISVFSMRRLATQGIKWFKAGDKVTFSSNNFPRSHHSNESYSSLSFEYDFPDAHDEVYFALNQPYTYSRLVSLLDELKDKSSLAIQTKSIGYTLSDNIIPVLKICKDVTNTEKQVILVLSRQHPCEGVGSFLAEGIMRYLAFDTSVAARSMLQKFDFVFVPMINPDGVIHGTSRCNIAGLDLNRQWGDAALKQLSPETFKVKNYITNLCGQRNVKYMLDLHGHGKKLNSFFFACKGQAREETRLLAMAMSKLEPRFNIYGCTYGISKDKESTARAKSFCLGIKHSYTLQTSLFGWRQNNQIVHYNENDFTQIGKSLVNSLFALECDQSVVEKQFGVTRESLISDLGLVIDKIEKQERINGMNKDVLSDSDPEGDRLDVQEILKNCNNPTINKKIKASYSTPVVPAQNLKKVKRKALNSSAMKLQNRSIRLSCPPQFQPKKVVEAQKSLNIQNNVQKIQQSKRHSLSDKWREKRKQITQKKKEELEKREVVQRLNLTRSSSRWQPENKEYTKMTILKARKTPTILTEDTVIIPHKAKMFHAKVKTELSDFKESKPLLKPSEVETDSLDIQKSKLQVRFKELRDESLAVLLTDTLSILKLNKNEQRKSFRKEKKQILAQTSVSEAKLSEESRMDFLLKARTQQSQSRPETTKHNRFRQFLNSQALRKRIVNYNNSVFYYFPII